MTFFITYIICAGSTFLTHGFTTKRCVGSATLRSLTGGTPHCAELPQLCFFGQTFWDDCPLKNEKSSDIIVGG